MSQRIHRITAVRLYFLPIKTRIPLKFGTQATTSVTCARVALRVTDESGREAEGWGETPLSVQWVWPSLLPYEQRHTALKAFCQHLASVWLAAGAEGHPLEIGQHFLEHVLPGVLTEFNGGEGGMLHSPQSTVHSADGGGARGQGRGAGENSRAEAVPHLAALVCSSPFDIALHDAFGKLVGRPVYQTYGPDFLTSDLARFLEPASDSKVSFSGRFAARFLEANPPKQLVAWHLVGGLDLLGRDELTGAEPQDGYPVLLEDWIRRDGLKCLKVKLRGTDAGWDFARLVKVGEIAAASAVEWLSADFNCTVEKPAYVNEILDRLQLEHPSIHKRLLYVEQPFPYDLGAHRIEVRSVSARKPLFLDESAHDWRLIRLGRELGWSGVALKTCKTQTGAILSACWAKAHGLALMVQDLTNPMLAQIPHALLAAHVGTIMGFETNACQFYPAASAPEEKVHRGLYQRRHGQIDFSSIQGPGFGYRIDEIGRSLPEAVVSLSAD
jgi:L-alanine-DL-glutamate epimerase-like enolase superfamily enzyme